MYKTIVVGFDGSESGRAALIESANRVKKHGGRIILVNAVYFDEEEFGIAPEQLDKRFEIGKQACSHAKDMILSEFGIQIEAFVCQGEPHEVLISMAVSKNADLIAMGTHGRKGLKRLIMGSVTAGVILNSPCDVLVVKKPCTTCTGQYNAILLPFDNSDFSKKALSRAYALAKEEGSDVTILYVIPRYEEMIEFMKTDSIRESLRDEARKILEAAKNSISGNGTLIKAVVQEGQAAEQIVEVAGKLHNDLIVMGSCGWTGMNKAIIGSTTERVIANAACPVLVVR